MNGILSSVISDKSAPSTSDLSFSVRKKRKRTKKDYPIFSEWAEKAPNPFWAAFFEDAAYGNFPEKFYMSGGQLVSKISRQRAIEIRTDNMDKVIKFIESTGVTLGYQDYSSTINNDVEDLTWSSIKRKPIIFKNKLHSWIDKQTKKYSLTKEQQNQLEHLVYMGISSDLINKDTLIMEKSEITEIRNIKYDPRSKKFLILKNPSYKYNYVTSKSANKKEDPFQRLWDLYCESIKAVEKINTNSTSTENITDYE